MATFNNIEALQKFVTEQEIVRNTNEIARIEHERQRVISYDKLQTLEDNHVHHEYEREEAEAQRRAEETKRETAEAYRKSEELTRIANEQERITRHNTQSAQYAKWNTDLNAIYSSINGDVLGDLNNLTGTFVYVNPENGHYVIKTKE